VSRSPTPRPRAAVDGPHLEALASILLEGVALEAGDPAQLVRLRAGTEDLGDGELELGLLPLDDVSHPFEGIVGFDAPDEWIAVGLIATGRASPLDGTGAAAGRRFGVRSAHLVARTGAWASAWRALRPGAGDPGSASGCGERDDEPMPAGRLDDALRRMLGLPTAPPPESTHRLWAAEWLDAVVDAAMSRRGRLGPAAVLARHPAVAAFDLDPAVMSVDDLVAAGDRLAGLRDWPELRRACADGRWSHPAIDHETAAWFDDGAFARAALAGWPDVTQSLDAVVAIAAPAAASLVITVLDRWGVELTETT
jgi:hypothetical protein